MRNGRTSSASGSSAPASRSLSPRLRCAVYTRKSTEEGLDQEFNSLDAQREACASFIASQMGLGWKLVPVRYDDGGISGGTIERPALQRLLQDIRDRKIDVVVVYKIDRLTRSLADFAKIVEVFDTNGVSFVSVTQQFNTTTSMGRLTLNVLLSFAQFEREVTAERIRDKFAASRKKGMWMGGTVPLGYRVQDRKLVIKEPAADFVRGLFSRYLQLKSVPKLALEVSRRAAAIARADAASASTVEMGIGAGIGADLAVHPRGGSNADNRRRLLDDVSSNGPHLSASNPTPPIERYGSRPMSPGMLYKLLANPLYIGKVRHKSEIYDGEHQAIVDVDAFNAVQRQLALGAQVPRGTAMHGNVHLLTGILFDDTGDRMAPTHGKAHGRRYRYYVSSRVRRSMEAAPDSWRVPAPEIEKITRDQAARILRDERLVAGWIEHHASVDLIQRCFHRAESVAASLSEQQPTDRQRSMMTQMFRSITLMPSAIRFEVKIREVVDLLLRDDERGDEDTPQTAAQDKSEPGIPVDTETIELPITMRRRGNGMRIVVGSPYVQPEPDPVLVDLVARAHVYLERLTGASPMGTGSIASTFGVDRADVGRILPLAFLSPAMLDAILTGRQSASLTPRQLARTELPILWAEQDAAIQ